MNFAEQVTVFACAGEALAGIVTKPDAPVKTGVLIIVGGPQYRVGSHRQFVLLARHLASEAIPVMRFDYRGMGDATGSMRTFEEIKSDIAAAIDTFHACCAELEQVVLWGLCDAASAALTYWRDTRDKRIAGMVLLNPWVRTETGRAKALVKHYYAHRLLDKQFWTGLARRQVKPLAAIRGLVESVRAATATTDRSKLIPVEAPFQDRMAEGLRTFDRPVLLILSGRDLTAMEFLEYTKGNSLWDELLGRPNVERYDLPAADHTFSSAEWRDKVSVLTLRWIRHSFCSAS